MKGLGDLHKKRENTTLKKENSTFKKINFLSIKMLQNPEN